MHTFFYGWRRKMGVVLLVVALAILLAWVRSTIVADFIGTPSDATTYYLVSHGGLLEFQRTTPNPERSPSPSAMDLPENGSTTFATTRPWFSTPPACMWGSLRLDWYDDKYGVRLGGVDVVWSDYNIEWQRSMGQFKIIAGNGGSRRALKIIVPCWVITLPLTFASAYLILWKPSKRAAPVANDSPMVILSSD